VTLVLLGIDLDTLQAFLDDSELRTIHLLHADTSLEPRLSTDYSLAFATSIGTPQDGSLSHVLLTVCIEAPSRRHLTPRR